MGNPVVHFEIIGTAPDALRAYYRELFDWQFDTPSPVAPEVSEGESYGFVTPLPMGSPDTIPGGVGGGAGFAPHTVFYVGVPNVEAALLRPKVWGAPACSDRHAIRVVSLSSRNSSIPRATSSVSPDPTDGDMPRIRKRRLVRGVFAGLRPSQIATRRACGSRPSRF